MRNRFLKNVKKDLTEQKMYDMVAIKLKKYSDKGKLRVIGGRKATELLARKLAGLPKRKGR